MRFGGPLAGSGRFLATVSIVAMMTACAVAPTPMSDNQLMVQGKEDFGSIFGDPEPGPVTLNLAESIARALKYNLDHRTRIMEEAMALNQVDLDRFDLLPTLTANAGYSDRDSHNISTSIDSITGLPSDANPTYSSDRAVITGDLTLSWNILDFGISYFSAQQNADRAMIASERRRKVIQNLVQEVRFAYWRLASAQVLKKEVVDTIALAQKALADAERVEKEGLKQPLEALRFQKTLLETIRQMESINQELSTAHIELASLVNLPPGTEIHVKVPDGGVLVSPGWDLDVDMMEELAFLNNPDIREQSYQSSIAVKETRKAILSLLPGISLTGGRHFNGDDLLVNNRWYEWSTKLTWNVLNIVMAPSRIRYAESSEKLAEMQRLALRMAVLAQVHVAERQFRNAAKQFERADQLAAGPVDRCRGRTRRRSRRPRVRSPIARFPVRIGRGPRVRRRSVRDDRGDRLRVDRPPRRITPGLARNRAGSPAVLRVEFRDTRGRRYRRPAPRRDRCVVCAPENFFRSAWKT